MARSAASMCLSEVVSHFEHLDDPRSTINRLHPLPGVLTISLMGVFAGADGPTGIHEWAVAKGNSCYKHWTCLNAGYVETSGQVSCEDHDEEPSIGG